MPTINNFPEIRLLQLSLPYFTTKAEKLSTSDLKTLNNVYEYYEKKCEKTLGYSIDPRITDVYSFHKYVKTSEINNLISKLIEEDTKREEKEREEKKREEKERRDREIKEQEVSIPPELESLVAEYEQNQALLKSEEVKASSQKSVAMQVKIAIAHTKIKEQARLNRQRRSSIENFQKPDEAFVEYGSPKSGSINSALSPSYKAVQEVAYTYGGFSVLPPDLQNEIITSAVELNTVGVSDIDTAIQAATLQVDISTLDEPVRKNLATIPGGFISSVYQEVVSLDKKTTEYETKISNNEQELVRLQNEISNLPEKSRIAESLKIKNIIAENENISASLEAQETRLTNSIAKQTVAFKDFEKNRESRLSRDPDLKDRIELANKTVSTIQENLGRNVEAHLYSPTDDIHLLEKALRHNLPGNLLPHATYQAEYAAALINNPKTQSLKLSPQAILLYSKDLTPELLAKARLFAINNPKSELGILFQNRKDLFDSTGSQLRKIAGSPLAKEISVSKTGLSNVFSSVSKSLGKVSDKIPGGIGTIFSVIQDPWGTLRSWAGRKAGEIIIKQIIQSITNESLKKGAEMLLKNGLKETMKKMLVQAATKAAAKAGAKAGIKVALEAGAQAANAVPGLGILLAIVIDILFWIGEKVIGAIKSFNRALYGEDVKTRDFLATPVMAVSGVVGGVITFISRLGTATAAAASSALGTITAGIVVGFVFYITSIAVAPLISTLVQLESTQRTQPINSCANIEGNFISQRDPIWGSTYCSNCTSSGSCSIGGSGCSSASITMILNSFGIESSVVDIWNLQHNTGGYYYYDEDKEEDTSIPFFGCGGTAEGAIDILSDKSLAVTNIGTNLDEADRVLSECGLILTLGYMACENGSLACGHFIVINGHNGDQITTMDPWKLEENFVHTLGSTFQIRQMWAVVP